MNLFQTSEGRSHSDRRRGGFMAWRNDSLEGEGTGTTGMTDGSPLWLPLIAGSNVPRPRPGVAFGACSSGSE